jgi:hypothetical protein
MIFFEVFGAKDSGIFSLPVYSINQVRDVRQIFLKFTFVQMRVLIIVLFIKWCIPLLKPDEVLSFELRNNYLLVVNQAKLKIIFQVIWINFLMW